MHDSRRTHLVSPARGFTLAELLVAVAAVLLLTIGIGQLFGNVGKLVSTGAAVSEVDQLARAIEKQFRDDFAGMSRLRAGDTILAIRSRTVGDIEGDGSLDTPDDRALYLTLEDLELDEREGFVNDPYADNDSDGLQDGRGVTVRLDEVLFLSFGGDQDAFVSAQEAGNGGSIVSAPMARLYYGHGLKPRLFTPAPVDFDPEDPETYLTGRPDPAPNDHWVPDGDFGQSRGEDNVFDQRVNVQGRNEFASEFVLARQALLLYGGLAIGHDNGARAGSVGANREIALLARDGDLRSIDTGASRLSNFNPFVRPGRGQQRRNLATLALLSHGRTDICAQSPESLKRWLEGYNDDLKNDATALDSGFFDDPSQPNSDPAPYPGDQALWWRDTTTPPGDQRRANNLKGLQSAIAGMFTRIQVESDAPSINRFTRLDQYDNAAFTAPGGREPEDTLMDLHATLASHCSNFEVAWSDGTRWTDENRRLEVDFEETIANRLSAVSNAAAVNPDTDVVYNFGDIIWFDSALPRRVLIAEFPNRYPQDTAIDPEILSEIDIPNERTNRLFIPNNPFINMPQRGEYDPGDNGIPGASAGDSNGNEYLAIWGYRRPGAGDDDYVTDWAKPIMLRFRMTLHDSQDRISGGKTFEFIVSIDTP